MDVLKYRNVVMPQASNNFLPPDMILMMAVSWPGLKDL